MILVRTLKPTLQGTRKWFNPEEEYGYITPDDGDEELFFSYSAT